MAEVVKPNSSAALLKLPKRAAVVVWQGRFWLLSFIPGGFLGMTLFFASGMNWTVTLLGFLAGNCVGVISEYGGQKLSEATTKRDGY